MKRKFQCCLIGEDNFTLACAEILLEHNYVINLICSDNECLIAWAKKNKIAICTSYTAFEEHVLCASFDFLFSILNSKILPGKVLDRAKILAINFHNALLPKYAGSHATSWSILNDELYHGVTWHKMAEDVDLGDIIKQGKIAVDRRSETALSLNMKCTEFGLKLFKEMITELEQDDCQLIPQNINLRTYFSKHSKPKGNGLINWNNTAENISSLFRACNFAHYNNEFSIPKIIINDQGVFFLAKQINISPIKSTSEPGTVISVTDKKIIISTQSYDLSIKEIYDCFGKACSIKDFVKINNITDGTILPCYDAEILEELETKSEMFSAQEKKWVEKLSAAKLPMVPEIMVTKCSKHDKNSKVFTFEVTSPALEKIKKQLAVSESYITLSLVLIYLQRINNYENFDLGIVKNNFFKHKQIERFFFNFFWFRCDFDPEINFNKFLSQLSLQLTDVKNNTNCLKDILARYPGVQSHYVLPNIIIVLDDTATEIIKAPIVIKIDCCSLHIIMNISNEDMAQDQQYLVESMGQKIQVMLEALNKNIHIPLYRLPLLNNFGLSLYVDTWSGLRKKKPLFDNSSIITIFEEQVTKYPLKVAVVEKNLSINYEDLNLQANNLAAYLLRSDVKLGDYVGVISITGIETIIALLAILKTGAVYVPIDPNYPEFYLSSILSDVKPKLILSKIFSSDKFETFLKNKYPSTSFHLIQYPIEAAFYEVTQTNHKKSLGYVMYTSGSTGRPKGVKVTQKGIIRLIINNNFLKIKSDYNIAQASNLSFDASTFEIWGALLNGATLVCINKEDTLNSVKFKNILEQTNIHILWVTASLFDQHIQNCPKIFNSIKYLLAGGDVVNPNSVRKIFNKTSRVELFINGYGPTENTTFTTTFALKPNDLIPQNIPIGRPIGNTSVYVVDKYLQPVSVGIPGELLIAGLGLSEGYITPDNNERFFETANITGEIQRYYKTGDYVKWLNDGNLAYLGRKDSQIKLRGFRVEINAIKDLILAHERISQCHIQICENSQLFLYIIPEHNSGLRKADVLDYLKNNLPYYMLPSEIIFLDKFPLNANGKIDVAAIKNFCINEEKLLLRKPESEIEKFLLALWQSILKTDAISTDSNFFEVGGNSLLVATLIYRIYQEFNVHIAISDFLTNPTILFLANLVFGNAAKTEDALVLSDANMNLESYISEKIDRTEEIKKIRTVFITGVTGFLGAFLLYELSKDKAKKIYCLVRADTFEAAQKKLENILNKWNLSAEILQNIHVLYGDLSKDYLGLSKNNYDVLLSEVDEIYHAAAQVNHVYSYAQLRNDNVLATLNLLKMLSKKHVRFNYISTISACFEHIDSEGRILESFIDEDAVPKKILDGYSLTKWTSEKILCKMHHLGFDINIFRPAWISGSSIDGSMPIVNNHLHLLLQACMQLKYAPAWDARINMTPVDQIAEAIVIKGDLNLRSKHVFNMINDQTISWINYINIIQDFGYNIKFIEPADWYNLLSKIDNTNALFRLASIYTDEKSRDWILKQDNISNAHNKNYLLLSRKLKNQVNIDISLLTRYFKYAFGTPVKDKINQELSASIN